MRVADLGETFRFDSRHLWVSVLVLGSLCAVAACATKTPPKSPDDLPAATVDAGAADPAPAANAVCTGADLDLTNVLVQSACEVPNAGTDAKRADLKGQLDVSVAVSPDTVAPGGHADIVVTFTNKAAVALPLDFVLDPTPRFGVEVYNGAMKRADLPRTKPPRAKGDGEASAPGTARVTIAGGGKATAKVGWDAVKLKWAPELAKGPVTDQTFPTAPAGPIAKGKYTLRIVTPLTNVSETADREVSTVKTAITVQ